MEIMKKYKISQGLIFDPARCRTLWRWPSKPFKHVVRSQHACCPIEAKEVIQSLSTDKCFERLGH